MASKKLRKQVVVMGRLRERLGLLFWEFVGYVVFFLLLVAYSLMWLMGYVTLFVMLIVGCALDTKIVGTVKCVRKIIREVFGHG